MTTARALKAINRFEDARMLLVIHGIMSGAESDKAKRRLHRWALTHGLQPKLTLTKEDL